MLDHIVYAVPDLAKAVADLQGRLGVRATLGASILVWAPIMRCYR
jgi:hypothetical protein